MTMMLRESTPGKPTPLVPVHRTMSRDMQDFLLTKSSSEKIFLARVQSTPAELPRAGGGSQSVGRSRQNAGPASIRPVPFGNDLSTHDVSVCPIRSTSSARVELPRFSGQSRV